MSIVADRVSKRFGPARGVGDITCAIAAGELVGLLGPNGAGKTTILRLLATFLTPDFGRVEVAGFDCVTAGLEVRRRLGYLPETLPAFPDARVDEYLEYRARLKEVPRRERRGEIDRCLAACRLTEVRRRLLGRLSHGMKRRVGLADALLGDPPVLLLDEPTVGLDPLQVIETRELLRELSGQRTVLLSTHLLAEAEAICSRALLLVQGKLVADVSLSELRRGGSFVVELRAAAEDVASLIQALTGSPPAALQPLEEGWLRGTFTGSADLRERLATEVVRRGWPLRELRSVGTSLEEHFVRLTVQSRGAA